jgi:threonine 3-dehydrogenase
VKALYKPAAGPGFELTDRPEPEAGPGEVKIRVLRTGICGTDLHIESWDDWAAGAIDAPLVPGHEFSGEVVGIGAGVNDVAVGDLVSGEGHVVCGTCRNCRAGRRHLCIRTSSVGVNRDGAFAEYVVLPESNVWVHHTRMNADLGAVFDPFGNAVHTALSFPLVGEDVLITGAGPIGLLAAMIGVHRGHNVHVLDRVTDGPKPGIVGDLGAEYHSGSVKDAPHPDVVIECTGVGELVFNVLQRTGRNGITVLTGLSGGTRSVPIPASAINDELVLENDAIVGSVNASRANYQQAADALAAADRDWLRQLITRKVPLDRWTDALDKEPDDVKVVVDLQA